MPRSPQEQTTPKAGAKLEEPTCYAHSANEQGQMHRLDDHLRAVAETAGQFCESFGSRLPAYYAGLWHDIGKFNPEFQSYLTGQTGHGPDHKGAGAKLSQSHLIPIGLLIQGHHGGLQALKDFKGWLNEKGTPPAAAAMEAARQALPELEPNSPLNPPDWVNISPTTGEMYLRMLFSALVDADFLDTEEHFSPARARNRATATHISELWRRFQTRHSELTKSQPSSATVASVRSEVYEHCIRAAEHPPGVFRLAVPTGGGKTLSSLAFALRHAEINNLERIITAIPFISITQQTAAAYRDILDPHHKAVLEHHSSVSHDDGYEYGPDHIWSRLASENWDAPVVVTTTVQLFNSLFSNSVSATRKLHNIANSVIILDEAQTLPRKLHAPILDALSELAKHYGTSVVLSTATQPAFQSIREFADITATEIIPSPERHYAKMKRVRYQWRTDPAWSWDDAAARMRESRQALTIVNTKKDALSLLEALDDETALHLSTLLCGQHRKEVINEIRRRLNTGEQCRVVSTQVVEAGVDLDFPTVLRAFGPLDSIIQAGGRCNRNGLLAEGQVVVFKPQQGTLPPGDYRKATDQTELMLNANRLAPEDPQAIRQYYQELYQVIGTDANCVQASRKNLDYPEVAKRFRMIDEETATAVVTAYGTPEDQRTVRAAINALKPGSPEARGLLRRIQPWTTSIYRQQATTLEHSGILCPIMPGLYEWLGPYDPVTGIGGAKAVDPERLVV